MRIDRDEDILFSRTIFLKTRRKVQCVRFDRGGGRKREERWHVRRVKIIRRVYETRLILDEDVWKEEELDGMFRIVAGEKRKRERLRTTPFEYKIHGNRCRESKEAGSKRVTRKN